MEVIPIATVAELLVKIGANSSGLRKELDATQRQIKRAFGPEALSFSGQAAGMLGLLTGAITAVGVAGVATAGKLGMTTRAFETLTGSAKAAKTMLSDLRTLDDQSSLNFEGLSQGAQRLLAFKFAAEDVIPVLNTVGDASAALGKGAEGVDRITLALSQIQSKGRVQGQEMLQLAEAGVNAYNYLADALNVSVPKLMKMIEKGVVDSSTGINAILLGMQKDYKGSMENMANETPVVWETIVSNATQILASFGKTIDEKLGINKTLQNIRNYLIDFKSSIEAVGINETLKNMIPPELTMGIFAVAGALTAAAIPAMIKFGIAVWSAMAPLIPFLAIGAAVGLLAYAIWKGWEPLKVLFSGLWQNIVGSCKWAWALIETIIFGALAGVFNAIDWAFKKLGVENPLGDFTETLNSNLQRATNDMNSASADMNEGMQKIIEGGKGFGQAMATEFKKIGDAAKDIQKQFKGLTNTKTVTPGLSEDELKKIENKVKQLSESIRREWVQTTKSDKEQLDIWLAEQIAALDESKQHNDNYQRDLDRVKAVYAERAKKIDEEERQRDLDKIKRMRDLKRAAQDMITNNNVKAGGIGLEGVDKELYDLTTNYNNAITEINRKYEDMQSDFASATAEGKQEMIQAWTEAGLAFQTFADGTVAFAEQAASDRLNIERQYNADVMALDYQRSKYNEQLEQARKDGNIQRYMELLNTEQGLFAQDLSGRQAMIDEYYAIWQETHRSAMSYMAEISEGVRGQLEDTFASVINGAASAGEAWQKFKSAFLSMIGQMVAKRLAAMTMELAFGKSMQTTMAATSAATAATLASAWSPAAAMVSLASYGANAAPAMAGISATVGLSAGLSAIPMLATGGITTGPTLAMIGEGKYDEAVVPLNKKAFEKVGLSNDKKEQQQPNFIFNPTIQALDTKSFRSWLDNGGGDEMARWMRKAYGEFVPVEV